jgi:hypothetical protein
MLLLRLVVHLYVVASSTALNVIFAITIVKAVALRRPVRLEDPRLTDRLVLSHFAEEKDVGIFLLMSHLSLDDALLLFLLPASGELGWPDEGFAVVLRASQRSAASARLADLGGDLIGVVLHASHRSTASARPGLLGGDWTGRMMAPMAAAQEGVGSSGIIFHCGGVGSSPGRAACAMARCTRATGTAINRLIEGDAAHAREEMPPHRLERAGGDEITTWQGDGRM